MEIEAVGPDTQTDGELLAEVAAGREPEAFSELVRRHTDLVYSVCLRVLGDPGSAEDAAQAAFLVLAQKASTLPPEVVLANWLYRVAELSARDMRRARERRARHEREAMQERQRDKSDPDSWTEVRPHLDAAMAALPGKLREVLVLHYLQGLSREAVARSLGCPEGTVQTRVSRGLHRLRENLRRAGVFVPAVSLTSFLSERAVEAAPRDLAASITTTCLAKALPAAAGAVAKHVAAKLYWTPLKIAVWAAGAAVAVLLPAGYVALRREPATEMAPPKGLLAAPSVPAALATAPQVQDNDGLHLDDAHSWLVQGSLPTHVTPTRVEVDLKPVPQMAQNLPAGKGPSGGLQHARKWDLAQGGVSLRLTLDTGPQPSHVTFRILVVLQSKSDEPGIASRGVGLVYDLDGTAFYDKRKGDYEDRDRFARKVFTMGMRGGVEPRMAAHGFGELRELMPGKNVLELMVSGTALWSRLNGETLFRGRHGEPADFAHFGFQAGTSGNLAGTPLAVEDVRIGPTDLLDAKTSDDF